MLYNIWTADIYFTWFRKYKICLKNDLWSDRRSHFVKYKNTWNASQKAFHTQDNINFYQGLNFKQYLLRAKKKKTYFKWRTHNYLISPRATNAASDTKGLFRSNVHLSQVDLSAETQTQTLYEYLDTHTHIIKVLPALTHTQSKRSKGMATTNPTSAAIRPKCDSSPLFLFIFNFFLQPPSFSL